MWVVFICEKEASLWIPSRSCDWWSPGLMVDLLGHFPICTHDLCSWVRVTTGSLSRTFALDYSVNQSQLWEEPWFQMKGDQAFSRSVPPSSPVSDLWGHFLTSSPGFSSEMSAVRPSMEDFCLCALQSSCRSISKMVQSQGRLEDRATVQVQ